MFTEKAQVVINRAASNALTRDKKLVDTEALLAALGADPEGIVRLAECLTDGNVDKMRANISPSADILPGRSRLDFDDYSRNIIKTAYELASVDGVPDRSHPGFIHVAHLAVALAMSEIVCRDFLGGCVPLERGRALQLLAGWSVQKSGFTDSIGGMVSNLRSLRGELLARIFGQDHAIHAFVEGLYNAEITASIDSDRKKPAAVFVFAGPPGVGKTYLAEMSASFLKRPFKRFDMTGYSDHQAHTQLVGFAPSYQGAHAGTLTDFVAKNPSSMLLFDEIEKAHLNTVQLFYQILDAGRLQDKFTEEEISFRDTIIIFTTNAGSSLYDNPNRAGIGAADADYHRRTILNALEQEKNPTTGLPAFPPAICSRLGQGYPLMFNHLGINELMRISTAELNRTASLLEKTYMKHFTYDPLLPISLVYSAGGNTDARELRADTEKFIKNELFKFASLYADEKVEDIFDEIDRVHFSIEGVSDTSDQAVTELYESVDQPKILLVAGADFARLCSEHVSSVQWFVAGTREEAAAILASTEIDLVLLDLWLPVKSTNGVGKVLAAAGKTLKQSLDFTPFSSRALSRGREILLKIHESFPEKPVYLLSFVDERQDLHQEMVRTSTYVMDATVAWDNMQMPVTVEMSPRRVVDDELFLVCVRSGGARGLINTDFKDNRFPGWEQRRDCFVSQLQNTAGRVYREAKASWLARQRKVLTYETAVELDRQGRLLTVRLRDFRLIRVVEASDAGEMVDDVQRPATRFGDVIGATAAKESLSFVVDWLKDPGYYTALGVRPPKGVLMTGPPGTGKTMLARAVAGESDCAFLEKAASSFVTIWQGSGPQNVRDLFARARRYAPAIVFIDEIDAVGVKRSGSMGGARSAEETLNALLTEMDGFAADRRRPVIVLAATNLAERLDEALVRRFDRVIEVDRPDRDARLAYLNKVLPDDQDTRVSRDVLKRLAGQAAGMTIADMERVVQEAAVVAARAKKPLDDTILEGAFEKIRLGEAARPPSREMLERVARHEAGHTLLAWLGGNLPVQVTIVGRRGAAGYMESEQDEERMIITKPEIEQRIREAMGGRAAELHFYGAEAGLSSGASGDLRQATQWALRMVREFAMDENFGCFGEFRQEQDNTGLADRAAIAAEKIVRQELEKACRAVSENSAALERLANMLLEKNRLVREEIAALLENILTN